MPTFAAIVGQDQARDALSQALASNHLAQAYLFTGPPGVGKAAVAKALARAANCEAKNPDACPPCNTCDRMERDLHPDLLWIHPDGAAIKVEQVRDLQLRLIVAPHEAQQRFAVLDPADSLNLQAQNALLKLLEEPPARTHLILISAAPQRLLKTVLSRCQRVLFPPLSPEQVVQALQQLGLGDATSRQAVAPYCDGSLERAAALLQDNTLSQQLKTVDALESAANEGSAGAIFQAVADHCNDRPSAVAVLELLRARAKDRAIASTENRTHVRRALQITQAIDDIFANASVPLTLENLALRWRTTS